MVCAVLARARVDGKSVLDILSRTVQLTEVLSSVWPMQSPGCQLSRRTPSTSPARSPEGARAQSKAWEGVGSFAQTGADIVSWRKPPLS